MKTEELFADSAFRCAASDYRWLREHGYPESPSLKLVGDKHRLSRTARNILYRSVIPVQVAENRRRRLIPLEASSHMGLGGRTLVVDAYNVVLTVLNYRLGHPVFRCADDLIRDAGGAKRRVNRLTVFLSVLDELASLLIAAGPNRAELYFDRPFSGSETHAAAMDASAADAAALIDCRLVDHADRAVVEAVRSASDAVLCSSDSGIIDATEAPLADIADRLLATTYGVSVPSIRSVFTHTPDSQYF